MPNQNKTADFSSRPRLFYPLNSFYLVLQGVHGSSDLGVPLGEDAERVPLWSRARASQCIARALDGITSVLGNLKSRSQRESERRVSNLEFEFDIAPITHDCLWLKMAWPVFPAWRPFGLRRSECRLACNDARYTEERRGFST